MVIGMDYPVIDPVGTGSNIRNLIRNSGNSIADVGRMCGSALCGFESRQSPYLIWFFD